MSKRRGRDRTGQTIADHLRKCWMLLCVGVTLLSPPLRAQTARHFGHQAWTTEDGLPQNSVHQVLQAHDGYLWIATEGGLARFDGLSFTVFRHEDQPGFPSDDIACLAEDTQGVLWVGTTDGLLRYADGHFSAVPLKNIAGPASVLALAAADDGSVMARTSSGVMHIVGNQIAPLQQGPATIETMASAPDHTVWFTAGNRLLQYRGGHLLTHGQLSTGNQPIELQIDRQGAAWVRSARGILPQSPAPNHERQSSPIVGLADILPLATTFLYDDAGDLWVGTKRGLFVVAITGGPVVQISAIGDRSVLSISRDREGDLWIGTESDGLHILRRQNVEQIAGLGDHPITALAQTGDGTVWIGTRDSGLRLYKQQSVSGSPSAATVPSLSTPLASEVILSLAAGGHNDVWVGTLDGLDHIDQGNVERYSSADGLPDDVIRSLLVDSDQSLWIGTRRGLIHWQGTRAAPFRHVSGLPSELIGAMLRPRSFAPTSEATRLLWLASLDGLSSLSDGKTPPIIHNYKVSSGSESIITSLAEDASGTLWIGTHGRGLAVMTASGLRSLPQSALPKDINSLLVDARGYLWMGTSRGILRASVQDLRECLSSSECTPPIARFGYADGMPTEEISASGHPAALRAQDGTLWFATARGVATLNPATMRDNAVPPPVVIEQLLIDNQIAPLSPRPLRLPFGHTNLTFEYAGLSFAAPSRVRYRYQLEGFDKLWTEAGARRSAYYTNLPPGAYTFRVQAANGDGIWNRSGAVLKFSILPPFYRRAWFYLLTLLVFASIAYAVYYLRVRRLRSEFDAVLAERNRIAREIHDTLAQNFVGISIHLQIAEQLLSANDAAATSQQLQQTRILVQEGLNDARQSIWELRASVAQDSLPTRIARAAERAARDGLTQQVKIGGIYRPLDATMEKEVLRVAQEALANVTRHAHATLLNVELRYESDGLQLAIMDNGRGFDPDAVSSVNDHFGLQGMRERAAALAATLSVTSSPENGTSVRLTVPLPRSERRSS